VALVGGPRPRKNMVPPFRLGKFVMPKHGPLDNLSKENLAGGRPLLKTSVEKKKKISQSLGLILQLCSLSCSSAATKQYLGMSFNPLLSLYSLLLL
jgi:hypothetical protein